MTRPRVPETDHGIQGTFTVAVFDEFQRSMRDRGWIETKSIIQAGIDKGEALEIGPGPGYLGLEWLRGTKGTRLKALEISPDMIKIGKKNAAHYGLPDRWDVVEGSGERIPFPEDRFDAVFSCGSLHEWQHPVETFREIIRVLKPEGLFFINDLRRDMFLLIKWVMKATCKPKAIRPGFETSLNAAYTPKEMAALLSEAAVGDVAVKTSPMGLTLIGRKNRVGHA